MRPRCEEVKFGQPLQAGVGAIRLLTASTANQLALASAVRDPDGGLALVVSLTDGQSVGPVVTIASIEAGSRFSLAAGQPDFEIAWSGLDAGIAEFRLAGLDGLGQLRSAEVVGTGHDVPGTLPQVSSGGGHTAVLWDPGSATYASREWTLMLTQRDSDGASRLAEIGNPLRGRDHLLLREAAEWALYYWLPSTQSEAGTVNLQRIDESGTRVGDPTTVQVVAGGASGQFQALAGGRGDGETLVVVSFRDQMSRTLTAVSCRSGSCGAPATIWSAPVAQTGTDREEVSVAWVQGAYWVTWQHDSTGFMAYVRSDLSIAAGPLALHVPVADGLSIREVGGAAFAAWRTPESGSVQVASLECVEAR